MKIEQNASGFINITEPSSQEMSIWAGMILLGVVPPNSVSLPLHSIANNITSLSRFGLTASTRDQTQRVSFDADLFLDQYCGEDTLLKRLQEKVGPGIWSVYQIGFDADGAVLLKFGIVLPVDMIGAEFTFECDGVAVEDLQLHQDPNFEYSHWFMPEGCVIGGTGRFPIKKRGNYIRFTLHFADSVDEKVRKAYRPLDSFTNVGLLDELPDIARIKRVAGSIANANSFLNGGRNASCRILDIAADYGKSVKKSLDVLDWGVGCGRVARHMAQHPKLSVSGIDIDSDNVEWCARNLRGDYRLTDLMPPSPCKDNQFDLIYSCSVLSHLTVDATDAWLAEINRMLKPDGLAILSFNGDTNFASYLGKRPADLRDALGKTMFVGDTNHDLDGFIPSTDYYRASFAESWWWRDKFKEFLELVDVEPAVVSGAQDMAVLRKKAGSSKAQNRR